MEIYIYIIYVVMFLFMFGYSKQVIIYNDPNAQKKSNLIKVFLIAFWRAIFWFFYLPKELGAIFAFIALTKLVHLNKERK